MSRQLSFSWDAITNFRKWLDISGGTRLTYRISYDTYNQTYSGNTQALADVKKTVENIILKNIDGRISQLWVSDYKSYTQQLDNETQIVVEIWWVADLDQAKELIWKTVELEFKLPNAWEWTQADKDERINIAQKLYSDLTANSDKFEAIAWSRQSENMKSFPSNGRWILFISIWRSKWKRSKYRYEWLYFLPHDIQRRMN